MDNYEKYVVAFLDILGFKNLIKEKGFNEIKEIFLSVISPDELVIALGRACTPEDEVLTNYNKTLKCTKIHIMSDSIIVAAPAICKEALAVVIDICSIIQERLYDFEMPILLRGAIDMGDFYLNGGIMFGEALINAYMAQEYYAKYPRIIVSNKLIEEMIVSVDKEYIELPEATDKYRYVNSLERYIGCSNIQKHSDLLESKKYNKILDMVRYQLKGYNSESVRDKYIWLQDVALKRIEREIAIREGILLL